MNESGCFFKALPDKGLVEKGKQAKGGQKTKQRLTVAFFVNASGEKVDQPIVIWKSKSQVVLRNYRIRHAQLMFTIFRILHLG